MKKTRSLTNRNFFGGFIGGMIGLLSFHFIAPLALPIGCFAGVVIGFWYQELKAVCGDFCAEIKKLQPKKTAEVVHPFDKASKAHMYGYWASIPLSFAILVIVFAIESGGEMLVTAMLFSMLSGIVGVIVLPNIRTNAVSLKDMKDYYKLLSLHERHGTSTVFLKALAVSSGWLLILSVLIPIATFLLLIFGGVAILFGFIGGISIFSLIVLVFGTMNQIYRIAMGRGHWLCFLVTVITTGSVAYGMEVADAGFASIIVWFSALFAGMLSGLLAVGLHQLTRVFVKQSVFYQNFEIVTVNTRFQNIITYGIDVLNKVRLWLFTPSGWQYRQRTA